MVQELHQAHSCKKKPLHRAQPLEEDAEISFENEPAVTSFIFQIQCFQNIDGMGNHAWRKMCLFKSASPDSGKRNKLK
ncbi:unnamed protein product [Linum trigynum]|uniref:Uncharacterized protein n=1 Tax=Linum trigynum TaxID=586398 RepID=A0AAV2D565_9ROSI